MAWLKGPRGTGNYIEVNEDVRFMKDVQNIGQNLIGDTYYVRDNGDDGKSGLNISEAFKTLEHAVHDVAGDWDTIILLPSTDAGPYLIEASEGTDDDNIPISITQTGLKIFGGQPTRYMWGSPAIHTHTTTTMVTIDANMVEIGFLSFHDQGAGISLQIGQGAVAWRSYIHDCHFGGNNTATYGVDMGGTYDAPFTVIERCYFTGYVEAGIRSNAYYSVVKDCDFEVYTAKYGILHSPTGGDRPGTRIIDNRFSTTDSTNAVGIQVSGTPTTGRFFVDGNHFVNFVNAAGCISKVNGYAGINYDNETAITAASA